MNNICSEQYIVCCPESLLEDGNHWMNTSEPSFPTSPILNLNSTDGTTNYSVIVVMCTPEAHKDRLDLQATGKLADAVDAQGRKTVRALEPTWNTKLEDGSDLVNMTKVTNARTNSVLKTRPEEGGKLVADPRKMMLVPDMGLAEFMALTRLKQLPEKE